MESTLSMTATGSAAPSADGAQRLADEHVAHISGDLRGRGAEHRWPGWGRPRPGRPALALGQVALDVDHVGLVARAPATMASLACLMAAGSSPLTTTESPPPPPKLWPAPTAISKPSALAGASVASSSLVLASRSVPDIEPDRHLGAVAGPALEGGLERLGAGVAGARDARLDERHRRVGHQQRPRPAWCGRARPPRTRPRAARPSPRGWPRCRYPGTGSGSGTRATARRRTAAARCRWWPSGSCASGGRA